MPLCPIPAGVGTPATAADWRLIDHLTSEEALAYLVGAEQPCHHWVHRGQCFAFDFPNLGVLFLYPNGALTNISTALGDAVGDGIDYFLKADGGTPGPLCWRVHEFLTAALTHVTYEYVAVGEGRRDKALTDMYWSTGPRDLVRQLVKCIPHPTPSKG
jgi:hypothetical protein